EDREDDHENRDQNDQQGDVGVMRELERTAIGTDRICAPIVSLSFHPKPFAVPYDLVSAAGAAAAVLWQLRQALSRIAIGRARLSVGPIGVSRSTTSSSRAGSLRNRPMMSASQSCARLDRLVGLSAGSR